MPCRCCRLRRCGPRAQLVGGLLDAAFMPAIGTSVKLADLTQIILTVCGRVTKPLFETCSDGCSNADIVLAMMSTLMMPKETRCACVQLRLLQSILRHSYT